MCLPAPYTWLSFSVELRYNRTAASYHLVMLHVFLDEQEHFVSLHKEEKGL